MVSRSLKRAIRFSLGAICIVMVLSLGVQAYSLKSTTENTRKALELGAAIAPSVDRTVKGPDLSAYQNLTKASIFYPMQKKEFKPPKLDGLLGGCAILDGRMRTEGEEVDGWKVAQITQNDVLLVREEDGEKFEQRLSLFQDHPTLEIDNRPKNQRKESEPRQFAGPEGADFSRLSEWRDRFARVRADRGGAASPSVSKGAREGEGPAASWFPNLTPEQIEQALNMTPQQLEQVIRERFGGVLPPGVDGEIIQKMIKSKAEKPGSKKSK